MQTLRAVRRERSSFDSRFFEKSEHFWAIREAARTFAENGDWPAVEDYAHAMSRPGPVRFVVAPPRKRRAGLPVVDEMYDARIVLERTVPTRERCWHDYLNALVWASFPDAKLALHGRQHRAIRAWVPEGATQLPNARTRELDALALIDEGGIMILRSPEYERAIPFGHALYEGLVLDNRSMIARSVVFDIDDVPANDADVIARTNELLAAALSDTSRFVSPDELPRTRLD